MFRFINYDKPGKGIDANAPKKRAVFRFLELYFRKLFSLMQLNVIYLFCCIPLVTIGPATAAMTFILREFSEERPVFLWVDFKKAMKKNFKQGFLVWLINLLLWIFLVLDGLILNSRPSLFGFVILGLLGMIALVFLMMQFFLYPLLVARKYTLLELYKNAFLLALSRVYSNLGILLVIGLLSWALYSVPILSLFLLAFFYFSTIGFVTVFYANGVLKKYFIS